jgi:hypothetical protein
MERDCASGGVPMSNPNVPVFIVIVSAIGIVMLCAFGAGLMVGQESVVSRVDEDCATLFAHHVNAGEMIVVESTGTILVISGDENAVGILGAGHINNCFER